MQNSKDKELFQRIQQADSKALEELFTLYYKTLCNFAVKIVPDAEVTQEVVADVFCVLWENAVQLEINKSVKAYLFTAVKHKAFETLRKRRPEFLDTEEGLIQHNGLAESPEETVLYKELQSEYQKAYETLPKQCQLIFKLNKIDGLKYREISDVLGISIKTVENQMGKALRLIRQQIKKYQLERH